MKGKTTETRRRQCIGGRGGSYGSAGAFGGKDEKVEEKNLDSVKKRESRRKVENKNRQ
jgi:hypothetical protein